MKKYLSILAFSCLTLCSCDNFLDLTPQSVLTPENAYENRKTGSKLFMPLMARSRKSLSGNIPLPLLNSEQMK